MRRLTLAGMGALGFNLSLCIAAGDASSTRPAAPAMSVSHKPTATLPLDSQRALIDEYCLTCHDDDKEKGGLSLQRYDVASAEREVLISSPYFIPDAEFRELIRSLVARGVRVAIVTNSLATNNHVVAHTGYKRWRRDVLRSGAEIYELRAHR